MNKVHIEKNSVQETLVIPLYGRKLCNERFPNLFQDKKAEELIDRLDYDFSALEKNAKSTAYQFGALEVAMRESDLMTEVRDYLAGNPKAAIVNLGCGLDQTAENCDNGKCFIYNIDLPDVMAVRDELLPGGERVKNIAADLNDFTWFDEIDSSNGVCFIAAGVFYYFKKEQIHRLVNAMAEHFPCCRLCFDAANTRAVKIMLKTWVKEAGITSIADYFSVDNVEKDILPWLKNATISSKGYMLGYNDLKDPSVPKLFRFMSKLGDGFMNMQIIRIDFTKEDDNK
ncbi:MAG: class I SAM-dependent methyltransferase [Clostridiales bacterium]|nr:class I SAM-dependent methyltransferase [Clostridiales bacterium]